MEKCNDYWCEHYEKNKGNCDRCLKNEAGKDKPDLRVMLEKNAAKHMGLGKKDKSAWQSR